MAQNSPEDRAAIADLERRINAVRENIIELTEQAAAFSGAADEDFTARRLAQQQDELDRLTRQLDALRSD